MVRVHCDPPVEVFQLKDSILTTAYREDEKEKKQKRPVKEDIEIYREMTFGLRIEKRRKNQANKSTGRMPRRHTPKKDAISCEKPRGAANRHRFVDIRMRELIKGEPLIPHNEYIVMEEATRGSETSKYPEEEKEKSIS